MKTPLATLLLVSTLAAQSGAYAQSAYTPEACQRMRPLMQDRLDKAQDRFDKAKAAARDAMPFLNRVRDDAIRNTKDQTARDAAYLATISLNTVGKSVVDIMKLNPVKCAATEVASVSARVFLEGVDKEELFEDVVLPTIAQGREGRANPDPETVKAIAEAAAGEVFGCALPVGAAIRAGYNLGKNVAEVSTVAGDARENRSVLLDAIESLERQMRRHQVRLIMTGRKLQEASAVRKDLEASCPSMPSKAESSSDFNKLVALADQMDKQDKLDLRSALDRAEQCNDMNCVTKALADASKLTRGSGDRMLVFKAQERADVRVGLLVADEEIRKKNIARAEQKKQEAAQPAQAAKAESNIFRDALVKAAVGAVADTLKEAAQRKLDGVAAGASSAPTGATNNTTTKQCKWMTITLPCDEVARRDALGREAERIRAEQTKRIYEGGVRFNKDAK